MLPSSYISGLKCLDLPEVDLEDVPCHAGKTAPAPAPCPRMVRSCACQVEAPGQGDQEEDDRGSEPSVLGEQSDQGHEVLAV